MLKKVSETNKLYEQAYEFLIGQISNGIYDLGDRLPSENEIATKLEMSRPTIRKAIARLQSDGIVVSKRGSGNFVHAKPTVHIQELSPGSGNISDMIHSFEIRSIIEGDAAGLAAERRTQTEVLQLQHIIQKQKASSSKPLSEVHKTDVEFHNAIADACRNPLIVEVVSSLNQSISNSWLLWNRIKPDEYTVIWERVIDEHILIFEAIRDGNKEQARKAMKSHLNNGLQRILNTSQLSNIDL